MNKNEYKMWTDIKYLEDIVTNPMIEVGKKSYYSGYYENQDFEDGCVRYLWGDEKTREAFDPRSENAWTIDRLIIGNYVCIASGVIILMGGNHNHKTNAISVYPFLSQIKDSYESKGDTIIKSDVWIGMNSKIMPGVSIHEGAIVAANSLVTKDVEPYTIVGGNPAKVIRHRFSKKDTEKLLEMRWFDWSDDHIENIEHLLVQSDINKLYAYYVKHIK